MNRSRWPIVIVLVVALLATGVTRQFASDRRNTGRALGTGATSSGGSALGRMNSFALALLLGGLRGPLVMILWTSSESQKGAKNLQGVDTQIEWIRLLQPEFDTVHIFQIWNKAYNLSVQMASLSNKYLTIIDALDYAHSVDQERPDNISIIYAIGGIFGDKLGDSAERLYYGKRVREESMPHASRQKLAENDPGYRRLQLDPVLDSDGQVLPGFLKPTLSTPLVDPNLPQDRYDGSELQFLPRFAPYRYGVSPFGFSYNYRKRAQLLQRLGNQTHAQLSEQVIDSRPALDLKKWSESEWELARRCELRAFGKAIPSERPEMELESQDVPLDVHVTESEHALLEQAVFGYDLGMRLSVASDSEYQEHLKLYASNFDLYASHRDELGAEQRLLAADRDYLKAILASPDQQASLRIAARNEYRKAITRYALLILRYYIPDQIAERTFPAGVNRSNFSVTLGAHADTLTPEDVLPILARSMQMIRAIPGPSNEDIDEYLGYIRRCDARLKYLPD